MTLSQIVIVSKPFMVRIKPNGRIPPMGSKVFKGDQNMLWDALPYALALTRMGQDTTFFIVDEKLGTADPNISCDDGDYLITSDYCNKMGGALWIHQDISSSPFYSTPIEPRIWKKLGVHLKYWDNSYVASAREHNILDILESLGIRIEMGNCVKALTESEEYAGIVPTSLTGQSMSTLELNPELLKHYWRLFVVAYKGAIRVTPKHRRHAVTCRARNLLLTFKNKLRSSSVKTVSQLQELFWEIGWDVIANQESPNITLASEIFNLSKPLVPHLLITTCLNHPIEFTEAYNDALNLAKLPLKRIRFGKDTMELPFFVEHKLKSGEFVRWRINASFNSRTINLELRYPPKGLTRSITFPKRPTFPEVQSALLSIWDNVTLIGKAGPLVAELTRPPRTLALPELGSKYAPMVYHLTRGLQLKGIDFPTGKILRLGVHAISALEILGDLQIILPPFLACFFGKRRSAKWIASNWQRCALRAKELISNIFYHPGQLLTLAQYALFEYEGKLPKPLPCKLTKLGDVCGISRPMNESVANKLKELVDIREELLSKRRLTLKDFDELDKLYNVNRAIELIMAGVLKRHIQLYQSSATDRRPFALSYYLAWGSEVINHMANLTHQRREIC